MLQHLLILLPYKRIPHLHYPRIQHLYTYIYQQATKAVTEQVKQQTLNQTVVQGQVAQFSNTFGSVIGNSTIAIAILLIIPLLAGMLIRYHQSLKTIGGGTNIRPIPFTINQLYRLLVAIGVIFTVLLIIIYLNAQIFFNIGLAANANVQALIDIQKNFITIIGTGFASLIAFYFGTRGTQASNAERTTAVERTTPVTQPELGQKALECIDVNPINVSVKDDKGNPVQGRTTLTNNNTTIVFTPIPTFNRNSRYTVSIKKSIMDISGASMTTDMEWHFTTAV